MVMEMSDQTGANGAVLPFQKPSLIKLTRKQRIFIEWWLAHPKASATEAAVQAYDVKNRNVANAIAAENLAKPSIRSQLESHVELVENVLVNTVKDFGSSKKVGHRALAVDTSKFVHDKIFGKATQKIDVRSTHLEVLIDLSGMKPAPAQE